MTARNRLIQCLAGWLLVAIAPVHAQVDFASLGNLSPEAEYRQLTLMLLVTGGAEPPLVEALLQQAGGPASVTPDFDPDAYRTPLTRIVDQDSMLAGSAHMFRFTRDHLQDMGERLLALETEHPETLGTFNMNVVHEDAIVIRQAIADSIEYSGVAQQPGIPPLLAHYRQGTVRLRNVLEYDLFSQELDRITAEAIRSVGGKLDAYQRMFEDELGTSTFDRHIDAAEYIYTKEFNQRAGDMTQDIIDNMVLLESQPNR